MELLGLVNRLLPNPASGPTGAVPGSEARDRLDSRLVEAATTLGRKAAERFNELPPTAQERQASADHAEPADVSTPAAPR